MKQEVNLTKAITLILTIIFVIGYVGTIIFVFVEKGPLCGFISMLVSGFIGLLAFANSTNKSPDSDWDDW